MFKRARAVGGVAGHASDFDESGNGIGERSKGTDQSEGFNVMGKFRPALEAMFTRDDQLRVGEGEGRAVKTRSGKLVKTRMVALDARKRGRIGDGKTFNQVLGLLFILFEVWARGQISVRHTKLLSHFAWSPRASGWKEDSWKCETEGGHGPFRGLDAPFALRMKVKNNGVEVKRARDGNGLRCDFGHVRQREDDDLTSGNGADCGKERTQRKLLARMPWRKSQTSTLLPKMPC